MFRGGEEEKKEVVFFYRSNRAQLECRRERLSPTDDREKLHSTAVQVVLEGFGWEEETCLPHTW